MKKLYRLQNENAVSAVIGVILMVAVTVAMAAVAYAYFTGMIGGNSKPAPVIGFTADYSGNAITLTHSDVDLKWEELKIIANDGTTSVNLITASGKTGTANIGEKIFVNGYGLTGTVSVTITYISSQTVMGDFSGENSFENVTP